MKKDYNESQCFESFYFSNSLFLLLSLARTHTPSHTLLCQHEQFFSGSLVSVMVQLLWRSEPGSCRSLSFWRAHRMRPCVRLPACACFACCKPFPMHLYFSPVCPSS